MRGLRLAVLVLLAAGVPDTRANAAERSWSADSIAVHAALGKFLTAFENLDWEPFCASFDDDATVFFPPPEVQERLDGRAAYEAGFRRIFDAIRPNNPNGPPFQSLKPEDLRIDSLGPGVALASFHMRNGERIARRTIVFRERNGVWRIAHLHASRKPVP